MTINESGEAIPELIMIIVFAPMSIYFIWESLKTELCLKTIPKKNSLNHNSAKILKELKH